MLVNYINILLKNYICRAAAVSVSFSSPKTIPQPRSGFVNALKELYVLWPNLVLQSLSNFLIQSMLSNRVVEYLVSGGYEGGKQR